MYAIQGDFRRFCFDRAVFTFGRALEAELNDVEGRNDGDVKSKRERVLDAWLDKPVRYRNPTATTRPGPTAGAETMSVGGDGG